jgi:hypothetical protein
MNSLDSISPQGMQRILPSEMGAIEFGLSARNKCQRRSDGAYPFLDLTSGAAAYAFPFLPWYGRCL